MHSYHRAVACVRYGRRLRASTSSSLGRQLPTGPAVSKHTSKQANKQASHSRTAQQATEAQSSILAQQHTCTAASWHRHTYTKRHVATAAAVLVGQLQAWRRLGYAPARGDVEEQLAVDCVVGILPAAQCKQSSLAGQAVAILNNNTLMTHGQHAAWPAR